MVASDMFERASYNSVRYESSIQSMDVAQRYSYAAFLSADLMIMHFFSFLSLIILFISFLRLIIVPSAH